MNFFPRPMKHNYVAEKNENFFHIRCKTHSSVNHKRRKTVVDCRFSEIHRPNSAIEDCGTIYLAVFNRFCWEKRRAKDVLRSTTKGAKLLLFVGLARYIVQILRLRIVAQFVWPSSIDSVERNGVQKRFFGQPQKAQNSCRLWVYRDTSSKCCDWGL